MVTATKLVEVLPFVLSLAQMIYYMEALDTYKDGLETMAKAATGWADAEAGYYKEFHNAEPAFYSYYMSLPDYDVCDSNIRRTKGRSFQTYGVKLREAAKVTRGFTPLANVLVSNSLGDDTVKNVAVERASRYNNEQTRANHAVLRRWNAIATAPVGAEENMSNAIGGIVRDGFDQFKSAAHGFNSAGAAFGVSLGKLMYSATNNDTSNQ